MIDLEEAGRCAFEAFAMATRDSLDLPPWDRIPPEARVHWRMTADAVIMYADLKRGTASSRTSAQR